MPESACQGRPVDRDVNALPRLRSSLRHASNLPSRWPGSSLALLGQWGAPCQRPGVPQSFCRVRADRASGIDPRAACLRHRQPSRSATGGRRSARTPTLKLPFGTLLHFKKDVERRAAAACCWSRRCRATSPRCCARPCARCCRTTTSTSPTGTTRATCRSTHGPFGFDEYVDYIIRFLEALGPGAHLVAVCQPCVQALAAVAVMAEDGNPAQPRSMTLMAGPIDTRINPTKVNKLATSKPIELVRAAT